MVNKKKNRFSLINIIMLSFIFLSLSALNTVNAQVSEPLNLEIDVFGYSATLTWEKPVSDGGGVGLTYFIQRGTETDNLANVGNTTALTYTDENLEPGKYFYRVVTFTSAGDAESTVETAQVADIGLMAVTGVAIAGIAALAGLGTIFILKKRQLSADEII